MLKENPLPKLIVLAQFVEEYHQEKNNGKEAEDTLHHWMKSIANAKNLTEAKEIYRIHPTISIVRESILRNSEILRKSIPRLNNAIIDWKNLPITERNEKKLLDSFLPLLVRK